MTDKQSNRSNGDRDESGDETGHGSGGNGGQPEYDSHDQPTVIQDDSTTGGGQPSTGQPSTGQPSTGQNQPSSGQAQPSTGQSQPSAGQSQPSTGQGTPSTGQGTPSTGQGQPSTGRDQPSTGGSQPNTGQPDTGQPSTGQPSTGQSTADQPSTGQPSTGQPSTGQSQSSSGQPSSGQPSSGQGRPSTGQGGQATATQGANATAATGSSGTGLEPNLAGALAYLFAPLAGIVMYVLEGDDDFVRFHAVQGIAFGVLMIGAWIATVIGAIVLGMILNQIPVIGGLLGWLTWLLYPVVFFVGFGAWAFLTYKAYQGERFELPVIGSFAASQ